MNMSLKPPVLAAVLGIGLLWYLTQRKAVAGGSGLYGATPASNASNASGYTTTPGAALRYGQAPAVTNNPAVALIQAAAGLFGGGSRPSAGAAAALAPGQIYRAPDYSPAAVFDNAGEVAAQQYYAEHQDAFIAVTPDYAAINSTPWALAALNDPSEF